MNHSRYEELIVGYVMGEDLGQDLHRDLIPHLASCNSCGDLFQSLQQTTSDLAYAAPAVQAAPELEDRIIGAIRDDVSVRFDPPARRTRSRMLLVAASFALIAAGAVGGTMVSSLQKAKSEQTQASHALQIVQDPRSLIARLSDPRSSGAGVVAIRPGGEAVLIVSGLPPAPEGFVHELWLIKDGVASPSEVFTVADSNGNTIVAFQALARNFDAAAITIEKGPRGSPKPTSDVLISGPARKTT